MVNIKIFANAVPLKAAATTVIVIYAYSQWHDRSNSVIAESPCPDERQLSTIALIADHYGAFLVSTTVFNFNILHTLYIVFERGGVGGEGAKRNRRQKQNHLKLPVQLL